MKFHKGSWGLRLDTRPHTKSDWMFLLMMNEGGTPVNFTIGYSKEIGWFYYLYFFGKRWHTSKKA